MKCKFETCDNEAKGNGAYCSKACRAKQSKRNRKAQPKQAQPEQIEAQPQAQPEGATMPAMNAKLVGVYDGDGGSLSKPTSQAMTADKFKVIKSKLAGGVAQPTGLPTKATKAMTAVELRNGVSSYVGQDWLASSEYAEVCLRLVTWTKAKLIESGQAVPAWKDTL